MYKTNKLQHEKRFVRDFHTRWFCIRNLTRSISDTSPTRVKIPLARAFREVISIPSTALFAAGAYYTKAFFGAATCISVYSGQTPHFFIFFVLLSRLLTTGKVVESKVAYLQS